MKFFYLPIAATSVAHYFGNACIKPAKYFTNKPSDVQDVYKDALLLTDVCTDCCFELILTEEECDLLQYVADGIFLFYGVLPISRVKSILFGDAQLMKNTLSNIRTSTAFIPENLPKVCKSYRPLNIQSAVQINTLSAVNLEEKIDLYNRILGALALMKLAKEKSMTYSDRYIATVAYFNDIIKRQLGDSEIANKDRGLSKLFGSNTLIADFSRIIDDDVIANQERVCRERIVKSLGIIQLDRINDKMLYTYAVLRTYGIDGDGKKRIDELITNNFADILEDRREAVAMYYGFNRGYNKFTNYYIAPASGNTVDVKFGLDSQLDYYLIESVYQFVFNNKISGELPYIDSWCPKLPTRRSLKDNEYRILDTIISARIDDKKKAGSEEWWSNWQDIFDSITLRDFSWTCIRKNICEPLFKEIRTSFKRSENNLNDEIKSLRERISTLEQENDKLKSRNQELEHSLSTQDKIIDTTEVVSSTPADIDNCTLDTSTSADEASVVEHNEDAYEPSSNDVDTHIEQSDSEDSLTQKITQENINDQVGNINGAQNADVHQQELMPVAELTQPISEPTKDMSEVSVNADTFPAPVPKKPRSNASGKGRKGTKSTAKKSGNAGNELDFEK